MTAWALGHKRETRFECVRVKSGGVAFESFECAVTCDLRCQGPSAPTEPSPDDSGAHPEALSLSDASDISRGGREATVSIVEAFPFIVKRFALVAGPRQMRWPESGRFASRPLQVERQNLSVPPRMAQILLQTATSIAVRAVLMCLKFAPAFPTQSIHTALICHSAAPMSTAEPVRAALICQKLPNLA